MSNIRTLLIRENIFSTKCLKNSSSFTVVVITFTQCFVTYTTGSQYLFCKFCIFWLMHVHLFFRDIFPFMFSSPRWTYIRIDSFGSLITFYPNKLFFESALKLKLWKLCENRNFGNPKINREMSIEDTFFISSSTLFCVVFFQNI